MSGSDPKDDRGTPSAASAFQVGDLLVWEPDKPHARAVVRVVKVEWNGEEWWYDADDIGEGGSHWNDEARMVEACVRYDEWRERPMEKAMDRGVVADIPTPYDESEVETRGTPFMLASRPPKLGPDTSAADADGVARRGHHESVGERQGGQPAQERPAAYVAREEYERVVAQRDALFARLEADPDRAAVATLDGLRNVIEGENGQIDRVLDWIGVAAGDDLSRAERVRLLAVEFATKQGYSLEEAERLAPAV